MKNLPVLIKRAPNAPLSRITGGGIKATYGNNLILYLRTDDPLRGIELRADRRVIVAILKKLLAQFDTVPEHHAAAVLPPAGQNTADKWNWVTPEEVIEKFRNSPNLRPMLKDVEAVLKPQTALNQEAADLDTAATIDPAELFEPNGMIKRGAQSRIAEALGIVNAGGYRPRIAQVLQNLQAKAA